MSDSFFVQISDTHIKAPGALAYRRVDTAAALRRCVRQLNALRPRPDCVLITGDLVDAGGEDEYRHLKTLLETCELPVRLMVGNHDARAPLRRVFAAHDYLNESGEFVQYAFDVGRLRILALDSLDAGKPGGRLCTQRLDWLCEQLDAAGTRPTVIALHHPPFLTGIGHMDQAVLDAASRTALAQVLQGRSHVERVLAGHLHRPIHTLFGGTLASTVGAPAHQVCLDPRPDAPSRFIMEPPSFALHVWQDGGRLVSHQAYIGDFDGPYPFHDADGRLID